MTRTIKTVQFILAATAWTVAAMVYGLQAVDMAGAMVRFAVRFWAGHGDVVIACVAVVWVPASGALAALHAWRIATGKE